MNSKVRFARWIAGLGATALILFMGWLLERDLAAAHEADQWVEHTLEVLRTGAEAREYVSTLASIAAGLPPASRGSVSAQQDQAASALLDSAAKLVALTADNPEQHARAQEIAQVARRWIDAAHRSRGPVTPDRFEAVREATNSLHARISQFQLEERRLLAERRNRQLEQQERGLLIFAALVVSCAILVARAYFVAARHRQKYERVEQQMQDLVEHLPLAVWQVQQRRDGTRHFLYLSPTAKRERGWDADVLRENYDLVSSTIVPQDRDRVGSDVREAQRTGGSFNVTYRAHGRDGRLRWVHSCAHIRSRPDGSYMWSGFWRDVSRDVAMEQQLKDANRQLQAFSYTVSHDLRTPLAAVMAFASAAQTLGGSALSGQIRDYLDKIRASGAHMQSMIEALLGLSRLSAQPLSRSIVDLGQMARDELDLLRVAQPNREVAVSIEGALTTEGDAALLRQAMSNLIGNAWKFTATREHAMITVGRGSDAMRDYFFVRDNGAGFHQEREEELFRPFHRLHRSDEFPGMGIGLATVARIIERHGGQIWTESEPGAGACFFFTLGTAGPATS